MLAQPYPPANKDYILSMQIALPTEIDIEFDLIRNKIIMLNRQIKSLKRVRDYLLPLLMNGQIKVKESKERLSVLQNTESFLLPSITAVYEFLLFIGSSTEIYSCCFNAFMPH